MRASGSRRFLLATALVVIVAIVAWIALRRSARPAAQPPPTATASSTTAKVAATHQPSTSPQPAVAHPAGEGRDYAAELEQARGFREPMLRSREFGRIFRAWLTEDFAAAVAYLRRLPIQSAEYTSGVSIAVGLLAQRDPDAALTLARELAVTREQRVIYSALFAQFAATNVQTAVQRLAVVPPGDGRENAIRALADTWGKVDFNAALAWAQSLDAADRAFAVEAVLQNIVATDPRRAVQVAQQSLSGAAFERTIAAAVQKLVETDPPGAAGIVAQLPPGQTQTFAALSVARALAAQNPANALTWVQSLPSGEPQRLAFNNVIDVWGGTDPAAAARYVAGMAPGTLQDAAAEQLARGRAVTSPQDAIAWAESLDSVSARDRALIAAASSWAQHDAAAAARWAATLPSGPVQTEALNGALSYWLLHDAQAAQSFVATLSGAALMNSAASIAPALAQSNPTAALDWARTLPSTEAREAAILAAYARWLDNAPAVARTWLAQATLPPELKAKLAQLK